MKRISQNDIIARFLHYLCENNYIYEKKYSTFFARIGI